MSPSIPVLIYHHINSHSGDTVTVTPDVFTDQMNFLAQAGYSTLSIDDLMNILRKGQKVSNKAVLITFDDGWLDNYLNAVPVLKKLRFKASFFIITGRVDAASNSRNRAVYDIPVHEVAKAFIRQGDAARVVLDWDTIRRVEENPFFRFYSHTVSHPRCAELSNNDLLDELSESKRRIESELGRPCPYLCWPYGSFTDNTIEAAKQSGYTGIFTTLEGFCDPVSDPLRIQRVEVMNSLEWMQDRLGLI